MFNTDDDGDLTGLARSSARAQTAIDLAEQQLIGMALQVNDDLWNIKHRRKLDCFEIDGTRTSWRRDTRAAARFRAMLHHGWSAPARPIAPSADVDAPVAAAGLAEAAEAAVE